MNNKNREHPHEDSLERFLLNTSSEEELETLEPHILACGDCIELLETLENQIAATRLALKQMLAAEQILGSSKGYSRRRNWLAFQRGSFAAGGALAAGVVILSFIPRDVNVTAYRGTETTVVSEGRRLRVHLNAEGLAAGTVEVELADSNRAIVWKGSSIVRDDKVQVWIPPLTRSGRYFLRLYSPHRVGSDGDLLREFTLEAWWRP
jgi:hypothetical protein